MSVVVHLSGHLKAFSDGVLHVDLPGNFQNIHDVLESLWRRHPALRDRVLTEQHDIRRHVNIFVGSSDVKRREGLHTVVDSNDIHIFNAVSGG